MQPMQARETQVINTERGKQLVPSAGKQKKLITMSARKQANGAKRGKTCGQYRVQEKIQPVRVKRGKGMVNTELGKTCNRSEARENMLPLPSASSCFLF